MSLIGERFGRLLLESIEFHLPSLWLSQRGTVHWIAVLPSASAALPLSILKCQPFELAMESLEKRLERLERLVNANRIVLQKKCFPDPILQALLAEHVFPGVWDETWQEIDVERTRIGKMRKLMDSMSYFGETAHRVLWRTIAASPQYIVLEQLPKPIRKLSPDFQAWSRTHELETCKGCDRVETWTLIAVGSESSMHLQLIFRATFYNFYFFFLILSCCAPAAQESHVEAVWKKVGGAFTVHST